MKKAKQILALAGVVILAAMYVITLILGFTASPSTKGMLMAALACTIIIPILLYAMMLVARVLGRKNEEKDIPSKKSKTSKK